MEIGAQSDGTYITPFAVTIFYDNSNTFETIVANLANRAQLICGPDPLARVEHPSNELVLFHAEYSREDIEKFLARGFRLIHVFAKTNPYQDVPSVAVFGVEDLDVHINFAGGAVSKVILEYVKSYFYDYTSPDPEVTDQTGSYFVEAMMCDGRPLPQLINDLIETVRGLDHVRDLVKVGEGIAKYRQKSALQRCSSGVICNAPSGERIFAVPFGDFRDMARDDVYIPKLAMAADYVMYYHIEHHPVSTSRICSGWRLILLRMGSGRPAIDIIGGEGHESFATNWVSISDAAKFLPFIYPG